jgi:hypothetical protein
VARAPSPAAFDLELNSRGRGRPRHTDSLRYKVSANRFVSFSNARSAWGWL